MEVQKVKEEDLVSISTSNAKESKISMLKNQSLMEQDQSFVILYNK